MNRRESLIPNGLPRYLRLYDNGGETYDRYTAVFTGRYRRRTGGEFIYVGFNGAPTHPMGFYQHGFSDNLIDRPGYSHLGKPIKFDELPETCQKLLLREYEDLWEIRTVH